MEMSMGGSSRLGPNFRGDALNRDGFFSPEIKFFLKKKYAKIFLITILYLMTMLGLQLLSHNKNVVGIQYQDNIKCSGFYLV